MSWSYFARFGFLLLFRLGMMQIKIYKRSLGNVSKTLVIWELAK